MAKRIVPNPHPQSEEIKTKTVSENIVNDYLYTPIMAEVIKAGENVAKYRNESSPEPINREIVDLLNNDIFNEKNWAINKFRQNAKPYIETIENNEIFSRFGESDPDKIYNIIIDLYKEAGIDKINDNTAAINFIGDIHKSTLIENILSTYKNKIETNNKIFVENTANAEYFYELISIKTDSYLYNDYIDNRVNEIKNKIDNKISQNNEAVFDLDQRIKNHDQTIKEFSEGKLKKKPEIESDFELEPRKFFAKIGERANTFASLVGEWSALGEFWFTIIFLIMNGFFFYLVFSNIYNSFSIIALLIVMYSAIFAMLPIFSAKHVYEFIQAGKKFKRGTIDESHAALIFEAVLIIFACTYIGIVIGNRDLIWEQKETEIAVIVGIVPFMTSSITGLMSYRRRKKDI